MPLNKDIKKVLVIGSGPIVIGQAAEFDYAGTQACSVLKQAGINVVLVNSNPATIMTDKSFADEIYLEPLTEESLQRIIEKERPDSLLASLGGQTGLTLGMKLAKSGFLQKMGVKLIGTNEEAIDRAEDRELFKETMLSIGQPVIPSEIATDIDGAVAAAQRIGYPVIIRPAFTLGGAGGGVAYDEEEFITIAKNGLLLSPITQILVEKYIYGWKEIEFEAMRDAAGTAITICSMENFDPVGVHTGDSIVIAPAVTLSNKEYQMLRNAALDIITALKIEGGCNCQFALDPNSFEYAVIEVNPRLSRSSALASKATGYPIAKVATKIALGYHLDEIDNDITGITKACVEPAVDFTVVKLPKWPFDKFVMASRKLGTQMKATGEVMAIAPSFEAALMKAVQGAAIGMENLNMPYMQTVNIKDELHNMDDRRVFAVFEALKRGMTLDEIYEITRIDKWFLGKINRLVAYEERLQSEKLTDELYLEGKKLGYTDHSIEDISGQKIANKLQASYKMVDTCAAEFAARTPYFYSCYEKACEARATASSNKKIIVLGSGPIRIGQGIEFDYSSVHCVWALKERGYEVVIVNNNPETVSTDYDTADRLYFEPLTKESIANILDIEQPEGVMVAFGGQTAIALTKFLHERGVKVMGTSAESIDIAEDRERFDELLEELQIKRPQGLTVMSEKEAVDAAAALTYPVLLRPSYVIGGQNMTIAHSAHDTVTYMRRILAQGIENPVLVDKYMPGIEVEVDVLCDGKDILIPGIMQHVERAGIHSGDSIAVYPPYNINDRMMQNIVDASRKLALALDIHGLINIQFLLFQNELYVIEVNPRASRTVPYISKVTGVPMVDIATGLSLGETLADMPYGTGLHHVPPYYSVKVPVFSFEKLSDVNAYLGPEMKSTGEVLGIGKNMNEALFKGLLSAGIYLKSPHNNDKVGFFISVESHDYGDTVKLAKKLSDLGLDLYATNDTAAVIEDLGISVERVSGIKESDNAFKLLESGKISYIVYTGAADDNSIDDYIALHRRALQLEIPCLTSLDTANALADILAARYTQQNTELVDINNLRSERQKLHFVKMHSLGNDFIFLENFNGEITCPESLCIEFCDRNYGIGADSIVLMERSEIADAKMRVFNRDGSEGKMAGNSIRCFAKYLYDKGIVKKEEMDIETASGVKHLKLNLRNGQVSSVCVYLGEPDFAASSLPVARDMIDDEEIINKRIELGGNQYDITCLSVGNPHCVVFCDSLEDIDMPVIGPLFENAPIFPERINTEFVRAVYKKTLKLRVYERGTGETMACGTGACAAVAAAVRNGLCPKNKDITVKLRGGDLLVHWSDEHGLLLTGGAALVYEGIAEY